MVFCFKIIWFEINGRIDFVSVIVLFEIENMMNDVWIDFW